MHLLCASHIEHSAGIIMLVATSVFVAGYLLFSRLFSR